MQVLKIFKRIKFKNKKKYSFKFIIKFFSFFNKIKLLLFFQLILKDFYKIFAIKKKLFYLFKCVCPSKR